VCVVPSEVAVERLVGVETQKLSDNLDCEDLGVRKLWGGTTLTDTPSFEPIVHQAEDGYDEGAKIHFEKTSFTPVGLVATERREVFSLVQDLKETCTRG
jgi:hypothetical protein